MKYLIIISLIFNFFGCQQAVSSKKYIAPEKPNIKKTVPKFAAGDKIGESIFIGSDASWSEQELIVKGIDALGKIEFSRAVNEEMDQNLNEAIDLLISRFCNSKCRIEFEWTGGYWIYQVTQTAGRNMAIGIWSEKKLIQANFEEKVNNLLHTPNYQDLRWVKNRRGLYSPLLGQRAGNKDPVGYFHYSTPDPYSSFFKEYGHLFYLTGAATNGYPYRKKVIKITSGSENGQKYLLVDFQNGSSKCIRDEFSKQELELIDLFQSFN
jgi:hypothetical protein